MRRVVVLSALVAMVTVFAAPAAGHVRAAPPATSSYVFVECMADLLSYSERDTGLNGQVQHVVGEIVWDDYFYDPAAGWFLAGTSTNPSYDILNTRTGVEVFRGTFNFRSPTLGDFSGTFIFHHDIASGRVGGSSVGLATDGTGRLWKAALAAVDPAGYEPLPACTAGGEFELLNRLDLVLP